MTDDPEFYLGPRGAFVAGDRDGMHTVATWRHGDPMPCGASLPPLHDPGWECTGEGLIVVWMWPGIDRPAIPIVLPARALDVIEPEAWWDTPLRRFEGGDHAHLVIPRRPETERRCPDTDPFRSPSGTRSPASRASSRSSRYS